MYLPAIHDENQTYAGYIAQQLEALRASALGLTDEQARSTPCRSALSIGGILKHVTHVLAGEVPEAADPGAPIDPVDAFYASFVMRPDESLTEVLARFDAMTAAVADRFSGDVDPDEEVVQPPAPWYGITEESTVRRRYQLMHIVEELSRHAGHADIIREQIDGALAPALVATVLGLPANPFVTPWTPSAT
ncbi:DinB family protein [Janibacter sp. GXQ6167]|uniref:DinB family protein n=1 Tax=Janibacter sp. GXQ6167 TaxID=3240791 RepID=UPI0035268CE2